MINNKMETLKDKEQRNYCESSIAPLIDFYFSSDVKKAVLDFQEIIKYDTELIKLYKLIFGNFKK